MVSDIGEGRVFKMGWCILVHAISVVHNAYHSNPQRAPKEIFRVTYSLPCWSGMTSGSFDLHIAFCSAWPSPHRPPNILQP